MKSHPSTASKALPVAAALSLACASFGNTQRTIAQDAQLTPPQATSAERRFDRNDLQRLESFSHFLTTHETLLPPLSDRPRIFRTLSTEGVLSHLNLHPLERTALEHLATTDALTLRIRIIATRGRVKDTFQESDMFGSLKKHKAPQTAEPLTHLTKEEMPGYARALAFCHLIAGHLATTSTNGNTSAQERYLNGLPIERHIKLLQTVGALELTEKVAPTTIASRTGRAYLIRVAETITQEDRANVSLLNEISHYKGNVWAYRALVLGMGAAAFGLYHTARRRVSAAENAAT